ncbi:MAG: DUF1634 domain-containing protein [Candidatus Marsarchaeota archaeon]|nr:DUF1634 domain-containing protein [Candidatus Marsarchaeota archaeon]
MRKTRIDAETKISFALIVGVLTSAALLAFGIAFSYLGRGNIALDGSYLLVLGIFTLFATPIIRVLMSIFMFYFEKNRLYTLITLIVFIDIIFALFVVPLLLHL